MTGPNMSEAMGFSLPTLTDVLKFPELFPRMVFIHAVWIAYAWMTTMRHGSKAARIVLYVFVAWFLLVALSGYGNYINPM